MQLVALDWIIVVVSIIVSFIPALLLAKRAGSSTAVSIWAPKTGRRPSRRR